MKMDTRHFQRYNYPNLNSGVNALLSVIPKDVPAFSVICYNNFTDTKNII